MDRLQVRTLEATAGDRLLLRSDGLSDVVSAGRVEHMLAESAHPTDVADRLVMAALEAEASDNVTVGVADVIEGPSSHRVGPVTVGAAAQPASEVLQALEALWPPGLSQGERHGRERAVPSIPIWLSLSIILGVLIVATAASLLKTRAEMVSAAENVEPREADQSRLERPETMTET